MRLGEPGRRARANQQYQGIRHCSEVRAFSRLFENYEKCRCITVYFVVSWPQMISPRRKRPQLALPTAAELDILAVLWTLGVATVREVHDELGKDNRYTTTLKTMQLMTEKGLLIRVERFGSHVYQRSEE